MDRIEEFLKKQSKQIRALYELQNQQMKKTIWIQNQLKQQIDKNNDVDFESQGFHGE
jgi:hypothetical protein